MGSFYIGRKNEKTFHDEKIRPNFIGYFSFKIEVTCLLKFLQTPSLMTPPTPLPRTSSRLPTFDPPIPKSPCMIEENSPAFYQSMRNKQKLAVLERFDDPSSSLPTLNNTPLSNRRESKLKTPFKVPFIDRLKKATE